MIYFTIWILLFIVGGILGSVIRYWPFLTVIYIPTIIFMIVTYKEIKKNTAKDTGEKITLTDIDRMDGIEFEHFLQRLFSNMGQEARVTQGSNDQGADLIVKESNWRFFFLKSSRKIAIQAKRYKNNVGNSAVQEVVAAKAHYDCQAAMVITNSYFTSSAQELAASNDVQLWDRDRLEEEIEATPVCFSDLAVS